MFNRLIHVLQSLSFNKRRNFLEVPTINYQLSIFHYQFVDITHLSELYFTIAFSIIVIAFSRSSILRTYDILISSIPRPGVA